MSENDITVSVICLVFNHAPYLRDALEGFVGQQTSFRYEVIVHDDASTDGSADIIREYAQKYPDIIVPILQTENQFSQGIDINRVHVLPLIRGKYIAFCEGDDYWCEPHKLQQQVDFLEAHTDYSACVHNTNKLNMMTSKTELVNKSKRAYDITLPDVLERFTRGGMLQTSSLMCRYSMSLESACDNPPLYCEILYRIGVGDFTRVIYCALHGKIRYLPEVMSVYRVMVPGSYSSKSADRIEAICAAFCEAFRCIDEETNGAYHESVERGIAEQQAVCLEVQCRHEELLKKENAALFHQCSRLAKLTAILKVYFPWGYRLLRRTLGQPL